MEKEVMEREFELYSDLHKDAYGSRPGVDKMKWFDALSYAEKETEWEYLCDMVEKSIEEDKIFSEKAIAEFEARIAKSAAELGVDPATIIRWDMDAHDVDGDVDYYKWQCGLPYHYELKVA